jgi:uncharacterized protein (DUF433 family)
LAKIANMDDDRGYRNESTSEPAAEFYRSPALAAAVDRRDQRRYRDGMDYTNYITIEPGKRSGQPCVRGMRITVQAVLEYLAGGMSVQEILGDFPELTVEDIRACLLLFAADRPRAA